MRSSFAPRFTPAHTRPLSSLRRRLSRRPRVYAYQTHNTQIEVFVKQANSQDFWAAAEVHASAFHRKGTRLAYNFAKISRFNDIVRSSHLRFGTDTILGWQARYICLVAQSRKKEGPSEEKKENDTSILTTMIRNVYPMEVRDGIVENPCDGGIYGAMNLDTTGRFIPSMAVLENGRKKRRRPQGCAYFSNLSVLPSVRGNGIGTSLLQEAERLAVEWGCWGAALHCGPENDSAYRLYTKQGYLHVQGAPTDKNGCLFLAKVFNTTP